MELYEKTDELEENTMIDYRSLNEYLSTFKIGLDDIKGKKVLDVGCGTGVFIKEARENGVEAYGIDNSEKTKDEKVDFIVYSDAERLPFLDDSFDVITNDFAALFYCDSAEKLESIINEQIRVLRKKGKIFISPIVDSEDGKFSFTVDPSSNTFNNQEIQLELLLCVETEVKVDHGDKMAMGIKFKFIELIRKLKQSGFEIKAFLGDQIDPTNHFWALEIIKP